MVKKPYSTPQLTRYGDFKTIVQGSLGRGADHGAPDHTKPCWIAAALYGVDDPRTVLLRAWLTDAYRQKRRGWPLVAAYIRFGQRAARAIPKSAVLRRGFRALFDRLAVRALTDLQTLYTG
jgi:hypothetical protein